MAERPYRHTQVATVTIVPLATGALFCAGLALAIANPIPLAFVLFLVVIGVLFTTLTTEVSNGSLECWFGPGAIKRRIPLRTVESVSVVRNRWYYGWGIRLTPHGWLWNVSGLGAIELQFLGGHRFRIGSDEPDRLADAIRAELGSAGAARSPGRR